MGRTRKKGNGIFTYQHVLIVRKRWIEIMKIIIVFLVIAFYVMLFRFASGTLKLKDLNILSFLFYNILVFDLIGASLIFLGMQKHYLIVKMVNKENIEKAYCILAYTVIMLPFVITVMNTCLYKRSTKEELSIYIRKKTMTNFNSNRLFIVALFFSSIALLSTAYTLKNISYLPLASMFNKNIDIGVASIENSQGFTGSQYIKNLGMTYLVPAMSYFAYIFARVKKEYKWYFLFGILFVVSIITETYDFSKAPVIYYLFYFYIIEVILGNVHGIKKIIPFILGAVLFLLFFYVVVLKQGNNVLTIYFGPVGRILFTQVATLFLHVDAFPLRHPYLQGASFASKFKFLFENASYTRSGRVVMELYSPEAVEDGTAGVMNTLFVGEAYANFGWIGVIIAPVIFGVTIALFLFLILKLKKTPVTVFFYVQVMQLLMTIVQGGFIDIFYNAAILFTIMIAILLCYVPKLRWRSD